MQQILMSRTASMEGAVRKLMICDLARLACTWRKSITLQLSSPRSLSNQILGRPSCSRVRCSSRFDKPVKLAKRDNASLSQGPSAAPSIISERIPPHTDFSPQTLFHIIFIPYASPLPILQTLCHQRLSCFRSSKASGLIYINPLHILL